MNKVKFKIWATLIWGYKYSFQNIPSICQIGWLPMFIVCVGFLSVPYFVAIGYESLTSAYLFPASFAASYFAVPWHRKILLNEKNVEQIRVRRPELIYFGLLLFMNYFDVAIELLATFLEVSTDNVIFQTSMWTSMVLILVIVSMMVPAIAIDDRQMTLGRAWGLWRGNRIRFLFFILLSGVVYGTLWTLLVKTNSFVSFRLADMINVDYGNISFYGADFLKFMFSYGVTSPILTVLMFLLFSSFVGALSISYAGIARNAMNTDQRYEPPKAMGHRLTA